MEGFSLMRFINKQQHTTSCGPVAVINAIKWLGISIPYRKYINMFKMLYWSTGGQRGQYPKYISSGLKLFGVKYKKLYHPTIKDIEEAIDRGSGVILQYKWYHKGNIGGHYVFIDHHTPTRFRAYNARKDGTPVEDKKYLKKWMTRSKKEGSYRPQMWEILST